MASALRCEAIAGHDRTQSSHEPRQDSLFRVVIAVSHQHVPCRTRNFGGPGTGIAAAVAKLVCFSSSAVACSSRLKSISQVVRQHGQLVVHAVHLPPRPGMRRQARIIIGHFDQVLPSCPLPVEPHHRVDGRVQIRERRRLARNLPATGFEGCCWRLAVLRGEREKARAILAGRLRVKARPPAGRDPTTAT